MIGGMKRDLATTYMFMGTVAAVRAAAITCVVCVLGRSAIALNDGSVRESDTLEVDLYP